MSGSSLQSLMMSKNAVAIKHLEIVCRSMQELRELGMTENLAIRHLEFLVNNYAKYKIVGKVSVDHVDEYKLWSKDASRQKKLHLHRRSGEYLRVEHGTPRRDFARLVLNQFEKGKLTEKWLDAKCKKLWKVAVITHEEDMRLNKFKTVKFKSPEARWAAAGIKF